MWIILLDRSSSMGNPFSGTGEFAGRGRTSGEKTKLAAAKAALREHLLGLGAPGRVALITFHQTAEVVFTGMSNDSAGVEAALEPIESLGGTDLAAALEQALSCVAQAAGEMFFRALVISDGQSDRDRAEAAARRVAARGVIIDVILIDPTPKGDEVARTVALNGNVTAVTSEKGLGEQVSEAAAAQERQRAEIEAVVAEHEAERGKLSAEVPAPERLAFTAWHPAIVAPETWHTLAIFLHLARLQDAIDRRIQELVERAGVIPALSMASASTAIPRGTWLTLSPRVPGVTFNPASLSVAWYEDIQEASFRLRADPETANTSAFGWIDISAGAVPVAQLGLNINVRAGAAPPQLTVQKASVFQQVFASYSREDAAIVEACAAAYWALGIHLYIDRKSIRSGQQWWPALQKFIEGSDLFQLYWSSSAAKSEPIKNEYEHALALLERKGQGFIRPTYWEDPHPKIPAPLKPFHFAPLDLDELSRQTGRTLAKPAATAPAEAAPVPALPIAASVVPLLPAASPGVVAQIRRDVGEAVSFLEEITGLRYYPVTTLLVDEHVVRRVRVVHTVDLAPEEAGIRDRALALADFLQAVCLDFHVGALTPPAPPDAEADAGETFALNFGAGGILTTGQFRWLKGTCEAFPSIGDVLEPQWRDALAALTGAGEAVSPGIGLTDFTSSYVDLVLSELSSVAGRALTLTLYGDQQYLPEPLRTTFQKAGGKVEEPSWMKLKGPGAAFRALLEDVKARLVALGPEVDSHDTSRSAAAPNADECLDLAGLADSLVRVLVERKSPLDRLEVRVGGPGRWYSDALEPRWRHVRTGLIEMGLADGKQLETLRECLDAFLTPVRAVLREGLRNLGDFDYTAHFAIPPASWDILQSDVPGVVLRIASEREDRGERSVYLSGRFSDVVAAFEQASDKLGALLSRTRKQRTAVQRVFSELAPTYGIFAPFDSQTADQALFRWAGAQAISPHLTLPETPRVLFCLSARERFEEKLREEAGPEMQPARLAGLFQRCVLVHEHFHAILETGIDGQRLAAPGAAARDKWNEASRLNESLAAWMELHFARRQEDFRRTVLDYISSGNYPDWPYAGALKIEADYEQRGLEAVRDWIDRMRRDPGSAAAAFDGIP